jgi:hypothetical protein
MSTQTRRRSRAYLDRLIEGSANGADPLAGLVRQIQAPPRRRETRGLRAASAAFMWAPTVRPYLPPHHRTGLSSAAASLWSPKVLAAGLAFVVAIGVAISATGNLPGGHSTTSVTSAGNAGNVTEIPQASISAHQGRSHVSAPTSPRAPVVGPVPSSVPAATTGSATPAPTSSGTPHLLPWLCQQWIQSTNAAVANNPLYQFLVDAAGGIDQVESYCTTLLAKSPSSSPSPSDAQVSADPSSSPTPTS